MKIAKCHNRGLKKQALERSFIIMPLLMALLFLGSCSKNFDSYYQRPSWLEKNALEVLEEKGNFSHYLKLVNRTLYSKVLSGSGHYSFFAPNDQAFEAWLLENNYEKVEDIPLNLATEMVAYSLIYNAYEAANLGNTWLSSAEWELGSSFRKQTPSYKTIFKEEVDGQKRWTMHSTGSFNESWHNYRYLPVFSNNYFTANGLSATDYNEFYQETDWNPANGNVLGAEILTPDIYVENGVVHEISQVIVPPVNLDEMISSQANDPAKSSQGWAMFKQLLYHKLSDSSYQFFLYSEDVDAQYYYNKMYPDSAISSVYLKVYNPEHIDVPLNLEGYYGPGEGITSENGAYTLFVPDDAAIKSYIDNTLLKYTDDFNKLPSTVLSTFIASHICDGLVWPSNFKMAKNLVGLEGEFINGKGVLGSDYASSGITSAQFASNGMVYTMDRVVKSGYFESVYGRLLLDPSYSYMNQVISANYNTSIYQYLLQSSYSGYLNENYTLMMPANDLLENDGYTFDPSNSSFSNETASSVGGVDVVARINRLAASGVFMRTMDYPLDNFTAAPAALANSYGGYGFAVNYYGDMIRYRNDYLQAAGNIADNDSVHLQKDTVNYANGQFYQLDKLINYSPRNTKGSSSEGWTESSLVSFVQNYLDKSDKTLFKAYWDSCLVEVEGSINSSAFYTVLIPTNDRMQEAIDAGYLPTLADVNTNLNGELIKAVAFINAHLIVGEVYPDDGLDRIFPGNYAAYKATTSHKITEAKVDLVLAKSYVDIAKDADQNKLIFRAADIESGNSVLVYGRGSVLGTQQVIRGLNNSNVMGPRAVLHSLDGFISFEVNPNLLSN
ncbi:MAG: hypothetical protein WCS66_01200 [Bacteroidales bacterium]